jgi:hypothetical protein
VEWIEGGLYGLRVEDDQSVARAQAAALREAEAFCATVRGGMPAVFASSNRSWPEVSFATYELVFTCAFDAGPDPRMSPEQALQALRAVSR